MGRWGAAGSLGERSWELRRRLLDVAVAMDLVIYRPLEYQKLRGWPSSVAAIAGREGRVLVG